MFDQKAVAEEMAAFQDACAKAPPRSDLFEFAMDLVRAQQAMIQSDLDRARPAVVEVGRCATCVHAIPGSSATHWCEEWKRDSIPTGFCHLHEPSVDDEEREREGAERQHAINEAYRSGER